jgi:hypothetical protein
MRPVVSSSPNRLQRRVAAPISGSGVSRPLNAEQNIFRLAREQEAIRFVIN